MPKAAFVKLTVENATPPQSSQLLHTAVIIPTCNASSYWPRLIDALSRQGIAPEQVLVIDSSSSDETRVLAGNAGFRIVRIPRADFRHGATRQMACKLLPWAEVLVYLTQDAIPRGDNALIELVSAFEDPSVGAVYGRQLPRPGAGPIESHARLFSYPETSDTRTFASRERLGFKAAFFSNSFAAYRKDALEDVGGFPENTIVSEEVTVAARMLMAGWKTKYQANAEAFHSHSLTVRQEASRYFDIGVHHGREEWLLNEFGGAGGEGRAFVVSQAKYLLAHKPILIPLAMIRNFSKFVFYQAGRRERYIPVALKKLLSGQKNFWTDEYIIPKREATEYDSDKLDLYSRTM